MARLFRERLAALATPLDPGFGIDHLDDEPLVRCPACDYRMVGLTESRCPECGAQYTLSELLAEVLDRAGYTVRTAADSKQLHTAHAAGAGLTAAYLAQDGFTGAQRILGQVVGEAVGVVELEGRFAGQRAAGRELRSGLVEQPKAHRQRLL